jgi:hypothetical protein
MHGDRDFCLDFVLVRLKSQACNVFVKPAVVAEEGPDYRLDRRSLKE